MKTPKEEYAVYPSLSVPARYGYDLHTKSKDEPIVVVCGIEEPKYISFLPNCKSSPDRLTKRSPMISGWNPEPARLNIEV